VILCLALVPWVAVADEKSAPPPKAPKVEAKPKPPRPADGIQDLLFLGDKQPLRIRLHLRVKDKLYEQQWEDYIALLFAYADVNGDKTLSKEEAARLPQPQILRSLAQGQLGFFGENSSAPFKELDTKKDGKVTLEGVKAYYRRAGFGPLQTQPDQDPGLSQTLTDALFKHLDLNKDGKLSKAELAAAEKSLAPLDLDEDELITVDELLPGREFGFGRGGSRPQPGNAGPALSLINADEPPEKQAAPILRRYDKDKNGKLSQAEIGFDDVTFTSLDTDKDGQLDAKELAAWFARPADLELMVPLMEPRRPRSANPLARFIWRPEKDLPPRLYNPDDRAMPLASTTHKTADGALLLTVDRTRVDFRKDRGANAFFDEVRRFYVDQFKAALRNNKTYLEKKESARNPRLKGLFPFMDRNGDGKVTQEEFNTFFDLIGEGTSAFTVVIISDRGPCLFELLDTNSDQQLSPRELKSAWKSLAAWDKGNKGAIAKEDLPRQLRVTVCAGMPTGRRRIFSNDDYGMDPPAKKAAGPLWFRKMDTNGDGDVSRREWLGSEEDFRKIDTDGDGLISLEEAIKADEWYRKKLATGK
jgi:Ca2+-binding EF-hand superfamily protein